MHPPTPTRNDFVVSENCYMLGPRPSFSGCISMKPKEFKAVTVSKSPRTVLSTELDDSSQDCIFFFPSSLSNCSQVQLHPRASQVMVVGEPEIVRFVQENPTSIENATDSDLFFHSEISCDSRHKMAISLEDDDGRIPQSLMFPSA